MSTDVDDHASESLPVLNQMEELSSPLLSIANGRTGKCKEFERPMSCNSQRKDWENPRKYKLSTGKTNISPQKVVNTDLGNIEATTIMIYAGK